MCIRDRHMGAFRRLLQERDWVFHRGNIHAIFGGVTVKNTQYPNIVEFQVTGAYALFSDPILRLGGAKCTYQVPTYEALKGILSSIYWKPTILWYIDAIRGMNPIQTEVKGMRPIKYHGGNEMCIRDRL